MLRGSVAQLLHTMTTSALEYERVAAGRAHTVIAEYLTITSNRAISHITLEFT